MSNTFINLPHGLNNDDHKDGFWSDALKRHLEATKEKGIRIGANRDNLSVLVDMGLEEGLDYFLRTRYARNPDTMHAVRSVKDAILATGDFEIRSVANDRKGKDPEWIFLKGY